MIKALSRAIRAPGRLLGLLRSVGESNSNLLRSFNDLHSSLLGSVNDLNSRVTAALQDRQPDAKVNHDLGAQLSYNFYDLSERLSALEEGLRAFKDGPSVIEDRLHAIQDRLHAFGDRSPIAEDRLRAIEDRLHVFGDRSPIIEDRLRAIEDRLHAFGDRSPIIEDRLRAIEDQLHAFGDRPPIIEDRLRAIGDRSPIIEEHLRAIEDRLHAFAGRLPPIEDIAARIDTSVSSQLNTLSSKQFEMLNLVTHVITSLESSANSIQTLQSETKNLLTHVSTSFLSRLNALDSDSAARLRSVQDRLPGLESLASHIDTSVNSRLDTLASKQFELGNLVTHIITSIESSANNVQTLQSETKNLLTHLDTSIHSRLNTLEFEWIDNLYDQLHEIMALVIELHANTDANRAARVPHKAERYQSAQSAPFEVSLDRAKTDFGSVFPLWKERLDNMLDAFRVTKVGNAANIDDPRAKYFRSFVDLHASGRILDVGCGVFGRPFYLAAYPGKLISGIDPLVPAEPFDFEFVRGISEYLPWPDQSFSTVISATSLDHCLSLERSLDEMWRVLRPGGRLLLWIDSQAGAAKYEPESPDFVPADQFHLFHFDVTWFEPILDRWFTVAERTELRRREFNRIMYCLEKRSRQKSTGIGGSLPPP